MANFLPDTTPVEVHFSDLFDAEESKIKQVYGTANPYVTPEKVRDTLASYGLEPQLSKFFDSDNFSPNKKMVPEASQTSRIPSSRGRNYGETRGWL